MADTRTVYSLMVAVSIEPNNVTKQSILADALEEAGLYEEAKQRRNIIELLTENLTYQSAITQITTNLKKRSNRPWIGMHRLDNILISSPTERRVFGNTATRNKLNDEDYEFLKKVFTGTFAYFHVDSTNIKFSGSPINLRYAVDLSAGIERINPAYGFTYDLHLSALNFIEKEPPAIPTRII